MNSVYLVIIVAHQCSIQAKTYNKSSQALTGAYELSMQQAMIAFSEPYLAKDLDLALQAVVPCCISRLVYHLQYSTEL